VSGEETVALFATDALDGGLLAFRLAAIVGVAVAELLLLLVLDSTSPPPFSPSRSTSIVSSLSSSSSSSSSCSPLLVVVFDGDGFSNSLFLTGVWLSCVIDTRRDSLVLCLDEERLS
jgi:hypothetical protein